jgi:CheY-like chemotaxis protein
MVRQFVGIPWGVAVRSTRENCIADSRCRRRSVDGGAAQKKVGGGTSFGYRGLDGRAALEIASSTDLDVMLLDVMLPSMDGIEAARRLRSENNHTPVVMLTARDSVPDIVRGLDVGADDYLIKPDLLARLRASARPYSGHAFRESAFRHYFPIRASPRAVLDCPSQAPGILPVHTLRIRTLLQSGRCAGGSPVG